MSITAYGGMFDFGYTGKWLAGWSHDPPLHDDMEIVTDTYDEARLWLLSELNWLAGDALPWIADKALEAGVKLAGTINHSSHEFQIGEASYYLIRKVVVS